jgi:hypothetical protein
MSAGLADVTLGDDTVSLAQKICYLNGMRPSQSHASANMQESAALKTNMMGMMVCVSLQSLWCSSLHL